MPDVGNDNNGLLATGLDLTDTTGDIDADDHVVISELTKIYGSLDERVVALDRVSLNLRPREFIAIVGPSGCGKTTLLMMLAGLVKATSGTMGIEGRDVHGPDPGMSLVFQSPTLLPWETVLNNVLMPMHVRKMKSEEVSLRAKQLLEMAGIADFADSYPSQLSGGMQQRVSICRALISDPTLLLMDEPFGALDAMTREQMNLELLRIWQQTRATVILITHSISEAVFLADRVIVMTPRPGRIRDDISIDAPRPRRLSMLAEPTLGDYMISVRKALEVPDAQDD